MTSSPDGSRLRNSPDAALADRTTNSRPRRDQRASANPIIHPSGDMSEMSWRASARHLGISAGRGQFQVDEAGVVGELERVEQLVGRDQAAQDAGPQVDELGRGGMAEQP